MKIKNGGKYVDLSSIYQQGTGEDILQLRDIIELVAVTSFVKS